jgi:CRISPR-associated protein Csa1
LRRGRVGRYGALRRQRADAPAPQPEASPALDGRLAALRRFEYHRIISRVQDVLARQPRVGTDSLATLAVPVTVEQQLDGSLLGLSGHLSTDALTAFAPLVFDVKFGPRCDFHRLATTAYALVLESLHECPVDVGCLVYVAFDGERILVQRDLHLLDDELRQWFIDERDERSRRVAEEIDPGKPEVCADDCPYGGHCIG